METKRIASFSVDHDLIDGDITTFDLRTRKPNGGDYIDDVTMHSVEHMLATYLRNSQKGENIIYFGPMGCRTGFYLLTRNLSPETVLEELKTALLNTINHKGEIFGNSRKECGNYKALDLERAQEECRKYLKILESKENIDFKYRTL